MPTFKDHFFFKQEMAFYSNLFFFILTIIPHLKSMREQAISYFSYKPDNNKTDINFDDLSHTNTNNNHTNTNNNLTNTNNNLTNINNNQTNTKINNNINVTQSHKLSKKKSGIIISDDIDEDEDDGVIFRNRGRIIYNKDNVSEETNPNFEHLD